MCEVRVDVKERVHPVIRAGSLRGCCHRNVFSTTPKGTFCQGAVEMTRTVVLMILILIVGGAAAIYVWSSLNELLKGQATLFQGVITVLAIVAIIGLILLLQRLSVSNEDGRD